MSTVRIDLNMSLDGFIAGPGRSAQRPAGTHAERLFAWMEAGAAEDAVDPNVRPPKASKALMDEWVAETTALIHGRRTFDAAGGWAEGHTLDVPNYVVTHDPPTEGDWDPHVEFVTDGPQAALDRAEAATGGEGLILVAGADVGCQLLRAGRVDELQINLAPVLLGDGVSLFGTLGVGPIDLDQRLVVESELVTHLRYAVLR